MADDREHPAPWRWDRETRALVDATGKPILMAVYADRGAEIAITAPVRALTEAAPELRDELEWALHVAAAYDAMLPQSDGFTARLAGARALLAQIEERSRG